MSFYRWNIFVLGMVAVIMAIAVAVNYKINFYGLFGDVTGKKYIVYDSDRTTKYLFAYNYIPSNFDGLLIGSSSTLNWNTGELSAIRMYNASLDGGNISEEALIADEVLRHRHARLVLVLIHPYLTDSYGRKSGHMVPQEYWGGLGSIQLLRGYWYKWKTEHGYKKLQTNEFGNYDFFIRQPGVGIAPPAVVRPPYIVEPRALEEYRDLLERVRASGARIVGVIPPVEMGAWRMSQAAFSSYLPKIRPFFREDEPIIDLTGPEMDEFRKNKYNYQDPVHLSSEGARKVMQVIDSRLRIIARSQSSAK